MQPNSELPNQESIAVMNDKQLLIDKIEQLIALSSDDIAQNNWIQANTQLKKGLNALGDRYFNPNILNDSGMKIIVADDFEKKGLLEKSARLRLRILQGRLDQFKANP